MPDEGVLPQPAALRVLLAYPFHPVIRLPASYDVYDFTTGYDPQRARRDYGVGRYDERRVGMYDAALFGGVRNVHMGIDIGAPVGEPVYAFWDGVVFGAAYHPAAGDYGHVVITEHLFGGLRLWALHGHLSARSLQGRAPGQPIARGEVLGWVGDRHENGGWNPHLHLQLALRAPTGNDMPGVVSEAEREAALRLYPDPRLVLGPLYADAS